MLPNVHYPTIFNLKYFFFTNSIIQPNCHTIYTVLDDLIPVTCALWNVHRYGAETVSDEPTVLGCRFASGTLKTASASPSFQSQPRIDTRRFYIHIVTKILQN